MSFTSHTLQEEHQGKGADLADCDTAGFLDNASLMALNDDCLRSVFSFLEKHELLKVSFVCQRFFNIVEREIRLSGHLDLTDMTKHFTSKETSRILCSFGGHIRSMSLCQTVEGQCNHIDFIGCCWKLEGIASCGFSLLDFETYKLMFQPNMGLTFLQLKSCNINDEVCFLISELPELQSLDLSQNSKITGLHLKKLRSLKELNLSDCENLESDHFIDICQAMQLKELNIVECLQLNDEAFNALISTQTELESLAFNWSQIVIQQNQVIEKLNKLKHVRIHLMDEPPVDQDILCELSPHRQETIESLAVFGVDIMTQKLDRERIFKLVNLTKLYIIADRSLDDKSLGEIAKRLKNIEQFGIVCCENVTEMGITNLVSNLRNLKLLDVSNCWHISYSLVSMIYKVLESRERERVKPLEILASITNISAEDLKRPDYQMHRQLVRVRFYWRPDDVANVWNNSKELSDYFKKF